MFTRFLRFFGLIEITMKKKNQLEEGGLTSCSSCGSDITVQGIILVIWGRNVYLLFFFYFNFCYFHIVHYMIIELKVKFWQIQFWQFNFDDKLPNSKIITQPQKSCCTVFMRESAKEIVIFIELR